MRGRFSEEQIVGILKEHEAGRKIAELAREHGVSEATLYGWKTKDGGMGVGEAQRLRSLEAQGFFGRPIVADWRRQLDFTTKIFHARGLHLNDRPSPPKSTTSGNKPWSCEVWSATNGIVQSGGMTSAGFTQLTLKGPAA
jgi:putative transposase